jgi:predicted DsbA family dithiol-disulfide isomerase
MPTLEIWFVSDIVCPWCAIGLHSLERALAKFPELNVKRRVLPFELNPGMSAEGELLVPYLSRKYGMSSEQVRENQVAIRERGAEVGFDFRMDLRTRTYNTRAAHRLLAWADTLEQTGGQWALKKQLLAAYFTHGHNPGDTEVLVASAQIAGLDPVTARDVIVSNAFDEVVVQEERQVHEWGIQAVPATILNQRFLVNGGQPVDAFVQAIQNSLS